MRANGSCRYTRHTIRKAPVAGRAREIYLSAVTRAAAPIIGPDLIAARAGSRAETMRAALGTLSGDGEKGRKRESRLLLRVREQEEGEDEWIGLAVPNDTI